MATSNLLASAKAVSSGCLTAAAKAAWPAAQARTFTAAAGVDVDMSVDVQTSYDVVIMGGGAVGCSIAYVGRKWGVTAPHRTPHSLTLGCARRYNLMKGDPTLQVAVIERDAMVRGV